MNQDVGDDQLTMLVVIETTISTHASAGPASLLLIGCGIGASYDESLRSAILAHLQANEQETESREVVRRNAE